MSWESLAAAAPTSSTSFQTSNDNLPEFPQWYVSMLLLSCILISVPNAVLLVALFKMKSLRKQVANHLIASFCLSDLVTGIVVFPLGIIHEIEYVQRYRHESASNSSSLSSLSKQQQLHDETVIPLDHYTSLNTTDVVFHDGHLHVKDGLNSGLNPLDFGAKNKDDIDDLGSGFCDLLQTSICFIGYVSLWHMTLIALDRYYRITSPITYKRWMTKTRAWYSCLFVWVLALAAAYFFYWHHKQTGIQYEPSQCVIYITSSYYVFAFAMVIGLIPMGMMIYYYVKLIILSRYSFKSNQPIEVYLPRRHHGQDNCIPMTSMRPMITCFLRRQNSSSSDSEEYDEMNEERSSRTEAEIMEIRARNKRCRRSKRAAVLVGFIVGGHFLLVLPTSTVYLCYTFWPELKIHQTSFFYLYPWCTFFNSAYNPWIYFLLTKELRHSVGQWFRRKFHWCHNR